MFRIAWQQPRTCSIDTDKTLYEIAYGESFSQDNSQEANLPSPINEIAHRMIQSHQDQLTTCTSTIEKLVKGMELVKSNMTTEGLNSLLSIPWQVPTLLAMGIMPVIGYTAISLANKIRADRHTPIKDRLPELEKDFPLLYAKLMG